MEWFREVLFRSPTYEYFELSKYWMKTRT